MSIRKIGDAIYKNLATQSEARDLLINEMHKVLKITRESIAAIHRNEMPKAQESIKNAQARLKAAQSHLKKLKHLSNQHIHQLPKR